MANKNDMLEALEEIENGMIRIKEKRSIWQNSLVYALCQAVRLLLIDKIKEGRKRGLSIYVNFDHMIDYLRKVRQSRNINNSPYMDNALLNMQQLLEFDIYNPILFDYVEIGGCDGCAWNGVRHQRCSCCRRNRSLKDGYTKGRAGNG